MKTNKILIIIFLILSILFFLMSIYIVKYVGGKYFDWYLGFSFALLGSSLIALITSYINYRFEKETICEKIGRIILKVNNDTQTEMFCMNRKIKLQQIINTISMFSGGCNEILFLLNSYQLGIFCFNYKERRIIDEINEFIYNKLIQLSSIAYEIKYKTLEFKNELKNNYEKVNTIVNDAAIIKSFNKLATFKKLNFMLFNFDDFINEVEKENK